MPPVSSVRNAPYEALPPVIALEIVTLGEALVPSAESSWRMASAPFVPVVSTSENSTIDQRTAFWFAAHVMTTGAAAPTLACKER